MRTVSIYQNHKRYDRNLNEKKEIKDGELFGVVLRRDDIYTITPQVTLEPGNSFRYNLLLEKANALNVRIGTLPLILKKISDGIAQDILTNNIFAFGNWNIVRRSFLDIDGDYEKFEHAISEIFDNKLIIDTQDKEDLNEEVYYEVDENFAAIYGEFTLRNKQETIDAINSFVAKTKEDYDKKFQDGIVSVLQNIAKQENLILSFEKANVKTRK